MARRREKSAQEKVAFFNQIVYLREPWFLIKHLSKDDQGPIEKLVDQLLMLRSTLHVSQTNLVFKE